MGYSGPDDPGNPEPADEQRPGNGDPHVELVYLAGRFPHLVEVARERARQVDELGWTHEHDDRHDLPEWGWLFLCRVTPLLNPWHPPQDGRVREFLRELSAVGLAALASWDRKRPS